MTTLQEPAPTFDDVWRMFKETNLQFQETDRKFQESEQKLQETERIMKESALEVGQKLKETERIMKESALEVGQKLKETERIMKESALETDKKLKENQLLVKNLSKNLGDLGNRLGEFVEHMIAPAVVRLFQALGVEVHEVHPSVEVNRNGEGIEIDLLVVNDGVLVAVECKSKLTLEHVDDHVKRMEKLKRLLPAYQNHRALGAVATMVMSDAVKEYAHRQGLYVLYQNGEGVEVSNPLGFTPTTW